MFRNKSRTERVKQRTGSLSFLPGAVAIFTGARPVAERLLYDDDLRDNIRTFVEAARKIYDEVSDEDASAVLSRLWDDDKLRTQIEAAAGAAQEGSKRVRGERVSGGGGGSRLMLLLLAAGVAFLFLNPRTGPEARRLAQEAIGALRSG